MKTATPMTPCYFTISSDYVFCVHYFWNEMRQKWHTERLRLLNKREATECLGCHIVTLQFALSSRNNVCAECAPCDLLLPFSLFCCVYSTVLALRPTCPCLTHTHTHTGAWNLHSWPVATCPDLSYWNVRGHRLPSNRWTLWVCARVCVCVCVSGAGKSWLLVCTHMALPLQQPQSRGGAGVGSRLGVCRGHHRSEVSEDDKGQWLHRGHSPRATFWLFTAFFLLLGYQWPGICGAIPDGLTRVLSKMSEVTAN